MKTLSINAQQSRRNFLGRLGAAGVLALTQRPLLADEPRRKLGIALAGLGNYSTGQLGPALKQTQYCRLAGVITGSHDKGLKWARDFGFPQTSIYGYDTMSQLADNPDIDAVYVVTPNSLHAEHVIAAARAGKHVICEKPMGISVAECDAMIAACRKAGKRLAIGYRLHYDPYHREMMRLARRENFGPFEKMQGTFAFKMRGRPWRAIRKLSGGGPLMDAGVYVIQAGCMAAGGIAPLAVTAHEILPKKSPEIFQDVEETIAWKMEFPGGVVCDGRSSYVEAGNTFRAESPKGWIEFTRTFAYRDLAASTSQGPLSFRNPEVNQQALQMDAFARNVLDDTPSLVPGEMGRRDLVIIEAIYASAAANGKRMEIRV
ncbi:MAG: Gfo/Idh/MocA family oxidoreductase [Opitutaceae bacterium]|nr:Gfo/Idh/MocA family oxidoreductase [Opitutaceae bacterium]